MTAMLKKLIAAMRRPAAARAAASDEYPLDTEARVGALHARIPVRRHLDVLFGDTRVGEESYVELYSRCLEDTQTVVTPFTILQRFQTRHDLLRYFLSTLDVEGGRIECGAYRGATALLLCRAWRTRVGDFDGRGFYVVDSFSGTAESTERDLIPVRDETGATCMTAFFPPGRTDVTVEDVRGYFNEFPQARVCAGWIPQVLETLPEQPWALVHLDVTLYDATLAALKYFHPRLARGGALVCVGSTFCPGVQQALTEYSRTTDAPYAQLGYGVSVFLRT